MGLKGKGFQSKGCQKSLAGNGSTGKDLAGKGKWISEAEEARFDRTESRWVQRRGRCMIETKHSIGWQTLFTKARQETPRMLRIVPGRREGDKWDGAS